MLVENTFRCIIVDDEPLARRLISNHLAKFPSLVLAESFSSPLDAREYLRRHETDAMFLDIQMPKLNGIELLKSMDRKPKVILTTAHREFALDGYELNVIDFLLKPVTLERFAAAVTKLVEQLVFEKKLLASSVEGLSHKAILIKSSHKLIRLPLEEVLYIEGLHKYIKIVTERETHATRYGLTAIEQDLPADFFRCHRSFIVNLNKVQSLAGGLLAVGKEKIPVSKFLKQALAEQLGKRIG